MKAIISFAIFFLFVSFANAAFIYKTDSSGVNAKSRNADENKISSDCKFKGFKLYGKIKFVTAFPDVKIQIVDAFPDIKVKMVEAFPDECGKWQSVEAFPDLKVQIVDAFPDIKVKFVDAFPGR